MFNFTLNSVHIHLMLVHFPIALSTLLPFLLIFGIYRKNKDIINVSLFGYMFTTLIAIPIFLSGRGAFESVSAIPGINIKALINHGQAAFNAFILIVILGILSFIVYLINRKTDYNNRKYLLYILVLLSIITLGAVTVAGNYGGNIRHTEIESIK